MKETESRLAACGVCLLAGAIIATVEFAIDRQGIKTKKINKNTYRLTEHVSYTVIPDNVEV